MTKRVIDKRSYCKDCKRSVYGEYKNCDINIINGGEYHKDTPCYCKIGLDGKMAEKYPWENGEKKEEKSYDDLIRREDVLAILKEVFDEYLINWKPDSELRTFSAAVPKAIMSIPTACNLDKVVEEIKDFGECALNVNETVIHASMKTAAEIVEKKGVK